MDLPTWSTNPTVATRPNNSLKVVSMATPLKKVIGQRCGGHWKVMSPCQSKLGHLYWLIWKEAVSFRGVITDEMIFRYPIGSMYGITDGFLSLHINAEQQPEIAMCKCVFYYLIPFLRPFTFGKWSKMVSHVFFWGGIHVTDQRTWPTVWWWWWNVWTHLKGTASKKSPWDNSTSSHNSMVSVKGWVYLQ